MSESYPQDASSEEQPSPAQSIGDLTPSSQKRNGAPHWAPRSLGG